jgi:hypothetical protein
VNFKLLFILVVISFSFSAAGQEVFFVTAPAGLICRSEPSVTAERTGKLPYGSLVELVANTSIQLEMVDNGESVKGAWVKVRYGNFPYLISSKPNDN